MIVNCIRQTKSGSKIYIGFRKKLLKAMDTESRLKEKQWILNFKFFTTKFSLRCMNVVKILQYKKYSYLLEQYHKRTSRKERIPANQPLEVSGKQFQFVLCNGAFSPP